MRRNWMIGAMACALGVCLWIVAGVVGYDWGRRTAQWQNRVDDVTSGQAFERSLAAKE